MDEQFNGDAFNLFNCMDCKEMKLVGVCIPCRNRFRDKALLRQSEEMKLKIERKKLWSKGTVEGTRQDILSLFNNPKE